MMALGVPAGANRPIDCCETIPGSPASTAVGIAGAAISRVGLVTARMRSLPVRLNSSNAPVTAGVTIATCPLMVSAVAGPEPRYGTCTRSGIPASDFNNSPVRWFNEPTPACP